MKAVFFDAGNTILHPHPSVTAVFSCVLAANGCDLEPRRIEEELHHADVIYEEQYRSDDTFWTREDRTSALWSQMYATVLRRAGVDGQADELGRMVYEEFGNARWWAAYPDVVPGLSRLKASGLALGMISNWDSRLPDICHELGLSGYFDFVISSANVGLHKPDPRIFEAALRRAGVEAADACHVGDHYYADVLGARSVGLTPVLIDRSGELPGADCLVVTGLDELADHMEGLAGI